ncbi:MAG: radical SAM protein [Clostridia bacterium]|nr:radical SAM protein [Clostridia bacterium]
MMAELYCNLCPRKCNVTRQKAVGYCGAPDTLKVARAALHFWEEPPISGENGSGAVFFSHCPLKCVYCQNREISSGGDGLEISVERLVEIFFELREKGAHNINLVSPTQYADKILCAIKSAKDKGFDIPFVWNTSGYESVETLKSLAGYVDVYLTDFKYASNELSKKYSHAQDYPAVAREALCEMMRQQPRCIFEDGIMKKGVIVRHMLLPSFTDDSKDVIDVFCDVCKNGAYLSLMRQYTPPKECGFTEIMRPVNDSEYDGVVGYAELLGIKKLFLQESESVSESFIPKFNYTGVLKGE